MLAHHKLVLLSLGRAEVVLDAPALRIGSQPITLLLRPLSSASRQAVVSADAADAARRGQVMEAAMTALMGVAARDNEAMKKFLLSRGSSEVVSMLTTPR